MRIKHFFDARTYTLTYVVWDPDCKQAVIIDPVLDFDTLDVRVYMESIERVSGFVAAEQLNVQWILETHAHADHFSGAQELKRRLGGLIAIGDQITAVQSTFRDVFDLGADFPVDGRQFDKLFADHATFEVGSLLFETIHTPGHTPACVSYKVGDAVFSGDALFLPDSGTGRCDFPAGSAENLYDSITNRLYTLSDETRVHVGHDYQPGGRDVGFETTIGASKKANIQIPGDRSLEEFVRFRTERDATLRPPKLIFPAVQVNIRAGEMPAPAANGRSYLKLPMNLLGS